MPIYETREYEAGQPSSLAVEDCSACFGERAGQSFTQRRPSAWCHHSAQWAGRVSRPGAKSTAWNRIPLDFGHAPFVVISAQLMERKPGLKLQ